ncbi:MULTISPECIES: FAD-dependent oxidoreductase [unclassified Sphingomonas]|uniref:FAD-dependent oxidoreductase n=1 Tax=unclassified Sphingomonas TaxID=196159 RepID=UPI000AF9EB00|nr:MULTISPECIES: bifunctional TVP38/TMEM64 family protein/FAD-dependent oxidoreductase [unclassified Sphingomonas]
MIRRIAILGLIGVLVVAFFYFDIGSLLTLESLKRSQSEFAGYYERSPLTVIAVFFLVYVAVTGASLPGAAILTLAAGALFGLVLGTVIVSFASSIGATLAFLASRYLFRDLVRARFGDRLRAIDAGVARDGAFYLFTLRLVPAFPFFLVNLLMGLTTIRVGTFYLVSQAGMFAGTAVFVNAGTQLAAIESLAGIASPGLIASFVALGIFPWIARGMVGWIKARQVYAKWQRPRRFDRNLVVIGAGAGGLVSAYIAAAVKAKVTLVEAHKMGGDCLNYGCVPSKALIRSAKTAHQMRSASHYGLTDTPPIVPFPAVMARIQQVIRDIEPHDSVERYTGLGVEVIQGYATIVDPWTVAIKRNDGGEERLTTRGIVIATGGTPFVPPIPGLEDVSYVTSDTMWDRFAELSEMPARIVVLGGGPIGCELTQSFARLGAQVTQVEMAPRLMTREDPDVSELVETRFRAEGVDVRTGSRAVRCERRGDGTQWLIVERDGATEEIAFDQLIVAVGRVARLTGYGLEALGIETGRTVITNEYLQTLYPNIYAAGDVAGPYQFTHVAAHQAWYAAVNSLFGQFRRYKADYRVIPWVTFTDPEVARVGLSESDAHEKGVAHEVTRFELHELDRAIADGATHGFVKVLTPPGKDRILGVTIVGDHAGEIIAEYVLAMKHGIGLNKLLGTIHSYPTMAEANKYVAGEWKRAHAPQGVLRWLERYHGWMRG